MTTVGGMPSIVIPQMAKRAASSHWTCSFVVVKTEEIPDMAGVWVAEC